jgi:hypothetical protein
MISFEDFEKKIIHTKFNKYLPTKLQVTKKLYLRIAPLSGDLLAKTKHCTDHISVLKKEALLVTK